MDLPKLFLHWKERPISQWLGVGNRILPQTASAILVIGIAYQAAKLTWLAIPGAPVDSPPPVLAPPSAGAAAGQRGGLDLTPVIEAHLFGEPDATPVPVVQTLVDAPDTALSLQLTGVISGDDDTSGWAIIAASRGEAKTYYVGDAIDNTNGAMLHAVYDDRVILNRAGRLETLRLPKELAASAAPRAMPQMPIAQQPDNSLREVISENASRLTEVIRVAPFIDQGQMVGFRINPAQNRALFDSLGLQPNDVVTDINGMALTDPSSGLQVFQSLGEATMANVTVLRNGTPEVLVIDTTQLQQLGEGRQ
jgi:general secretion pathway protein C